MFIFIIIVQRGHPYKILIVILMFVLLEEDQYKDSIDSIDNVDLVLILYI